MAARSDVELLEELLALEQRLISAYEAALRREVIDVALGELLRDHEREHADAIERALAGSGQRNPRAIVPEPELTAALRARLGGRGGRRLRADGGRYPQPAPAPAARFDHGLRGRPRGRAAQCVRNCPPGGLT